MSVETVKWRPHPGPQEEALKRGEFEILYGGARAGGKTEAGLIWEIEPSYINHPKYRGIVIRENAKDLAQWIDRAEAMYSTFGIRKVGNPVSFVAPSGAKIWTGHLKDESSYKHYLGQEYQKILIEELTTIPSEELYLKLIGSCRSKYKELKPQVFATTNPGNKGHIWVKQRWVRHGPMNPYQDPETGLYRVYIPAKVYDNPTILENDPNYVRWLDGLPDKLRAAWRDGDWNVFEGQFFDTWNERIHVYHPFAIPKDWPRIRAMDWGYSDHFCCLWAAIGPDNHLYVYREFYKNRLTDSEYSEKIQYLSKYHDGTDEKFILEVGDPGSFWNKVPETGVPRVETFWLNGINLTQANNDRVQGWTRLREYMQPRSVEGIITVGFEPIAGMAPWIHVSSECYNLIRTLPALVHHEKKVEDVADGMEDHAPDALRYLVMSRKPVWREAYEKPKSHYEAALRQAERNDRGGAESWI